MVTMCLDAINIVARYNTLAPNIYIANCSHNEINFVKTMILDLDVSLYKCSYLSSYSMVVLYSRDRYEIIWLLEISHSTYKTTL